MSAWTGMNGSKAGASKNHQGKQQSASDVNSYFKINDIDKLINIAINKVAEEKPNDFKNGLADALENASHMAKKDKKAHSKEDAESAKKYLESHNAEAILSEILGKIAVSMPSNPAQVLAHHAREATGQAPAGQAASSPSKGGKKDKKDDKPAAASSAPKQQDTSGPPAGVDAKKWKAAVKEGGKKGVELAGCADMGGLEFFTTTIDSADGALELLVAAMDGANKEPDPNEEEAKGGSGMVGKMFLSSSDKQLALMCYVPESKTSKCNASEWMKAVLASVNGEFIEGNEKVAKGRSVGDGQNKFPLKDKDTCQGASVSWLKERGLFPQGDDEGDDWVPDEDAGIEW
uniref:Uncharacterized protein n=1 Tax=Hanusia phi TaxID=3032 RepID=A0A7S0DZ84_9CRYP|mmetsp:Transcript_13450/g.30974  ORF Transcript_13450/g.30974 Transcript_13450/m.30974 type:complete len:346 (+) Transcript_13450:85-1122(+)